MAHDFAGASAPLADILSLQDVFPDLTAEQEEGTEDLLADQDNPESAADDFSTGSAAGPGSGLSLVAADNVADITLSSGATPGVATVSGSFGGPNWNAQLGAADVSISLTSAAIQGCGCPMCSGDGSSGNATAQGAADLAAAAAGAPGAPGAAVSMQTLANYLTTGFWDDFSGTDARWYNMTSSGTGANSGVLYYNVTGWTGSLSTVYGNESDSNGITAARADMVRAAFAVYEEVLGINFIETTSEAGHVDFFFKDNSSGAYEAESLHAGVGGAMDYSVINVNSGWSGGSSNIGGTNGYTFQTFLHEIGHALGLGHQGDYNAGAGTPTYANSAQWANDSWAQTMMSYWSQTENTEFSTDDYAQLVSPMAVDWIALNNLYAGQGYGTSNAFNGNTIYGVGTNISNATSEAFAGLAGFADTNAFTIVDGSGIDTVDFSNYAVDQTINLLPSSASNNRATLSSVGGLTYNMTIAVGTIIENATTGGGNDFIFGNEVDNVLTGNGGNDYLSSYGGDDTLYAGAGTDTLYGGDGNDYLYAGAFTSSDQFYGGAGNDFITSGLGTETMDGGTGNDTIDHTAFDGDYIFNMATGLTNFGGESYTNFEAAWMGDGNDSVTGATSLRETIYGGLGDDTLDAGASTLGDIVYGGDGNDSIRSGIGNESMYGGNGIDVIDHRAYDGNYVFNLGTGLTNFGAELYTGFEAVYMGDGNDSVTGTSGDNTIYGGDGNDTINDGSGGDAVYGGDGNDLFNTGDSSFTGDSFYGGLGTDTLSYEIHDWGTPFSPVVFDFTTGIASYSGFTETFSSIEIFRGSQGDETIISNGGDQTYYGNDGNDSMVSGIGDETMYGGNGIDVIDHRAWDASYTFNMATGLTNFSGELYTGFEIAYMGDGDDSVTGSAGADTIYGGIGADTLYGGGSVDDLYGGAGNDFFLYVSNESYDNYYGGADVDHVEFQPFFGDDLVINLAIGSFDGGGVTRAFTGIEWVTTSTGNDTVTGNAADNRIFLGDGNDSVLGNAGNDTLDAGAGNDTLNGGLGADSMTGGAGDDSYNVDDAGDVIVELNEAGIDLVRSSVSFSLGANSQYLENLILLGSADIDGIGNTIANNLTGNTGANALTGGAGNDALYGGAGNDTLNGGLDDDALYGGVGNDSLLGAAGNDTLNGAVGVDTMAGGLGDDFYVVNEAGDTIVELSGPSGGIDSVSSLVTFSLAAQTGDIEHLTLGGATNINGTGNGLANMLTGNDGDNQLDGLGAADSLYGGLGNDTLDGGTGADMLVGGTGNDVYVIDDAGDTITELVGEGSADSILTDVDVQMATLAANVENLTMRNVATAVTVSGNALANIMNGNIFANSITGWGAADSLFGGAGNDSLYGGNQNDLLNGGADNDVLYGGNDADTLIGNIGNDTLHGQAGDDILTGGAGGDVFVFAGVWGTDTITDFATAGLVEKIDLSAIAAIVNFADLVTNHLTQLGLDTIITNGANTITLTGITMGNLSADDFLF
ncbi:M10 family metallopeptidase C-terminal domain-containing protein [Cypionkella sp.]|uniref:M10 family metallopeptidase C-terminal domain-containing protein n=1 Tax=Cypionkella sp. TaxID=2811411 RepID=UPI002ABBAE76|nr:M10 family metallopeptidase C-terminal domain-containing protein [Cypionkella sp.]MDZ4393497.1 M12 family metallo-peptidase [Cypionkella sp.]